jgi:hypothetical protein
VKPPGARNSAPHSKEVAQREPVRRGCCFLPRSILPPLRVDGIGDRALRNCPLYLLAPQERKKPGSGAPLGGAHVCAQRVGGGDAREAGRGDGESGRSDLAFVSWLVLGHSEPYYWTRPESTSTRRKRQQPWSALPKLFCQHHHTFILCLSKFRRVDKRTCPTPEVLFGTPRRF